MVCGMAWYNDSDAGVLPYTCIRAAMVVERDSGKRSGAMLIFLVSLQCFLNILLYDLNALSCFRVICHNIFSIPLETSQKHAF